MRADARAQREQELDDARTRKVMQAGRSSLVPGEVVDVDDGARKAVLHLEGKSSPSAGIDYGEHAPVVGDECIVEIPPLTGRRRIVAITSRDAGYVAAGTVSTPKIVAGVAAGTVAKATLTLDTNLTYRPGLLVFRDDGARSHQMTPLVNPSGQITAVFDAYTEVVDTNRTRVTITATALTTTGVPATDWRVYVLRERADIPRHG